MGVLASSRQPGFALRERVEGRADEQEKNRKSIDPSFPLSNQARIF
jgi:hypothetical protein